MFQDGGLLLISLVGVRILNAVFVETTFVPDETWQSLEVAHRHVFGTGYLTWEWHEGIRSYVHVLPFVLLYRLLALLGLDTVHALVVGPRVLQGSSMYALGIMRRRLFLGTILLLSLVALIVLFVHIQLMTLIVRSTFFPTN